MPKGLRYKLILAFSLMSIVPLLVCGVIISVYVYNNEFFVVGDISLILLITIVITVLGLFIAKSIVEPVIDIAEKVKLYNNGSDFQEIPVNREDEIGDLSYSINKMASKLTRNVDTLKGYEERIRGINLEINKKMTALSTLFQVSSIMSSAKDLNIILQTVIERLPDVMDCEKSFLVIFDDQNKSVHLKATNNLKPDEIEGLEKDFSEGILSRISKQRETLILDTQHKITNITKVLSSKLDLKNIVVFPVILHGEVQCALILGNNKDNFSFSDDDIDLMRVFSKQVSIALENNWLMKKTEELSVKDELTGLFNVKYIKDRLNEEIQRAITYQRPCSFILFDVDKFDTYEDKFGKSAAEDVLKRVASILKTNVDQIDKVARFDHSQFALILPERNKREAHLVADKVRQMVNEFEFMNQEEMPGKKLTISGAVTANPIDGVNSEELISKAKMLLSQDQSEEGNKIYA
jgi:diguanylate cyclase (GGDEF)-like protein